MFYSMEPAIGQVLHSNLFFLVGPVDGAPRFSAFQEVEMLPGMMGNGTHNSNHNNIKPHSNLIVSFSEKNVSIIDSVLNKMV